MNKYQEALDFLIEEAYENYNKKNVQTREDKEKIFNNYGVLKKLVDRASPKKPETSGDGSEYGYIIYDTWCCPNCNKNFEIDYDRYGYCPHCGQAIDNTELDEMR